MSRFSCPIVRIAHLRRIASADEIDHAQILGCEVIVSRGRYRVGDLAVYVPPGSVLPDGLAESLKGTVKLFGSRRNRVRSYQLRGAFSDGILIGPLHQATLGVDAAHALGITKYEPPIPPAWRGACVHLPDQVIPYDIESARRHPGVLCAGEAVELTEKLHGTFCAVGFRPGLAHPSLIEGDTVVYSKGLGYTGHGFIAENADNIYIKTAIDFMLRGNLKIAFNNHPATAFGEIYGGTVQDLNYGRDAPTFALFDIYLGMPGKGRWLERNEFDIVCDYIAPRAPVLYRGPLERDIVTDFSGGRTIAGNSAHLSEGAVIRPMRERAHPRIGRVILKYVSTEYLTRANGTEFE